MRGLSTLFCEILKCGFELKNGKVSDETEAAIELYFQLSIKIENTKCDLSENWFGFLREKSVRDCSILLLSSAHMDFNIKLVCERLINTKRINLEGQVEGRIEPNPAHAYKTKPEDLSMSSDLRGEFGDWEATIRECVCGSIHFYLVLYIINGI